MEMARADVVTFGSRSSWSALLSGAVIILTVLFILTGIGWGITFVAMGPNDFLGGFIAGAIILEACTLVAACVGGYLAGWLIPRTRGIGALHGLLACALAFLLASGFWLRATRATTALATQTAQTAAQTTGAVGAAGGNVAGGAVNFLESLGYTSAQSHQMVSDAQRSIQRALHSPTGAAATPEATARSAMKGVLDFTGGAMWIYMGVWLIACLCAAGFGALGAKRGVLVTEAERAPVPPVPGGYTPPLRPQEV